MTDALRLGKVIAAAPQRREACRRQPLVRRIRNPSEATQRKNAVRGTIAAAPDAADG